MESQVFLLAVDVAIMVSLRALPWIRSDRRKHERTKVAIPCKVIVGSHVLVGKTKDISLGGVCFRVQLSADTAQSISKCRAVIALILPEKEIEIACTIVRVEDEAVAVQFKGLARSGNEETLREFLRTQLGRFV
jgi:hypothetical protein